MHMASDHVCENTPVITESYQSWHQPIIGDLIKAENMLKIQLELDLANYVCDFNLQPFSNVLSSFFSYEASVSCSDNK